MSFFSEHKDDLIQLFVIILAGFVLYQMIFLVSYKEYIKANWTDYRCNPIFAPMAGLFGIPDPTSDTGYLTASKNVKDCLQLKMTSNLNSHMKPALSGLGGISGAMGNATNSLNVFSQISNSLKSGVTSVTGNIMSRIDAGKSLMSYYNIKFKELLKKMFAVFMLLLYTLKSTEGLLLGIVQGPIGASISDLMCFNQDTLITLKNNEQKLIKNIQIGDILLSDSSDNSECRVIGITKSNAPKFINLCADNIISSLVEILTFVKISASGILGVIKFTLLINFFLSKSIALLSINFVPPFAIITGSKIIFLVFKFFRELITSLTTFDE